MQFGTTTNKEQYERYHGVIIIINLSDTDENYEFRKKNVGVDQNIILDSGQSIHHTPSFFRIARFS